MIEFLRGLQHIYRVLGKHGLIQSYLIYLSCVVRKTSVLLYFWKLFSYFFAAAC